jgi:hypothetical protein
MGMADVYQPTEREQAALRALSLGTSRLGLRTRGPTIDARIVRRLRGYGYATTVGNAARITETGRLALARCG